MTNNFDKIVTELSYRVSTGLPDFKNEEHLEILIDILKEHRWKDDKIVNLVKNIILLSEAESIPNKTEPKDNETATPEKEPIQTDKSGNYVPSEKDRQIVAKTLELTSTKTSMLSSPEDVELMDNFENDVDQLLNSRSKDLAYALIKKYKLKINKEVELGNPSKLYIGAIDSKYRKIFSGTTGNLASTIVAQILKDTGAIGKKVGFTKKSMTVEK